MHSPILSAITFSLACGARGVVKASSYARNTNAATTTTVVNDVICQVSLTDFMILSSDGVQKGGHRYDCLNILGTWPHEIHLHFAYNSFVRQENENALINESWYISFPLDWVSEDGHLLPNESEQVTTLTLAEVDDALMQQQQQHHGARSLQNGLLRKKRTASVMSETNNHHRRLGAIGARNCGIVIVHATDRWNPLTVVAAERAVYTTASNQFRACSNNAMSLNRKDATIFVTLPRTIGSYDSTTVYDAARVAVCTYYGQPSNCEPSIIRGLEHILYSLPFGTSDDVGGNNWAYASIGGTRKFSIYNGNYFIPSTIIHELGHNLYLGHAVEGADEYGDQTGQMGGGGGDARCFNGFNMYVLGWMSGQTKTIDTLSPGGIERYTLKSLADMGTGGFVNIKIGPLFLVYNMGKGLNTGTREYQNHILIHQAFGFSVLPPHADTTLRGTLSKVGDRLEVNNFRGNDKAIVVLCAIDKVGSSGATIVVGLNRAECASSFALQSETTHVATTNHPITFAGTDKYSTGSTNLVLHKTGAALPLTATGPSMFERVTPIHQHLVLEPEADTSSSPVVLQVDAALPMSSSVDAGLHGSFAFDIKCDNMWKDTVAIQGFVGEHTCEWIFDQGGGAYCDSAMMMAGSSFGPPEPVKKRCQVQCLQECAYAAVCRRSGDNCGNTTSTSGIGQCCAGASCVDGICR